MTQVIDLICKEVRHLFSFFSSSNLVLIFSVVAVVVIDLARQFAFLSCCDANLVSSVLISACLVKHPY